LAGLVAGYLFDNRPDHTARATPRGPEINDHRYVGVKYLTLKSSVGYFHHISGQSALLSDVVCSLKPY
jgi:hypothetical protein